MVIVGLGIWMSIWGPISRRNINKGLMLIIIGLVLLVVSILFMTMSGWNSSIVYDWRQIHWQFSDIYNKHFGPFPFGLLSLCLFVIVNGILLKNNSSIKKSIGVNMVTVAMLIVLYTFGPIIS